MMVSMERCADASRAYWSSEASRADHQRPGSVGACGPSRQSWRHSVSAPQARRTMPAASATGCTAARLASEMRQEWLQESSQPNS